MEDDHNYQPLLSNNTTTAPSDLPIPFEDGGDIGQVSNLGDFFKEFYNESRKLWYLAGPSILTNVLQYSLGALTQIFSGHLGTSQLAAISMESSVIAGLGSGILVRTYPCSN